MLDILVILLLATIMGGVLFYTLKITEKYKVNVLVEFILVAVALYLTTGVIVIVYKFGGVLWQFKWWERLVSVCLKICSL